MGESTDDVNRWAEATEKRPVGSPELKSMGTEFNSLLQELHARTSELKGQSGMSKLDRALKILMAEGAKRKPKAGEK